MAGDTAQLDATSPTAPAALRLRPVEPIDGEAVHILLTAAIPGILEDRGRWLRRWHWQCWDNPYRGNRPAGWVLSDAGHVVGHLGAVYVPFRIGQARAIGMIAADYAVGPDALARGGMFAGLQLAKTFFDAAGDAVPMATTANDKTAAVFARFGCSAVPWTQEFWRAPVTLVQQIRTCRGATSRIARRILTQPGGPTLTHVASQLYRATRRRPGIPLPPDCRIEITTPRLARDLGGIDDRTTAVAINRDADYLEWRYARHPERANVRTIVLRHNDAATIAGVFLFLEDRGPQRIAFVEDLIAPPDRPDTVRTLLCAALRLAAENHADMLVTTTGRHDLRGIYWELGFESRARSAPAAVIQYPPSSQPRVEPSTDPSWRVQASGSPTTEPPDLEARLELWHGAMF